MLWHVGNEFVEHAALPEQRMGEVAPSSWTLWRLVGYGSVRAASVSAS